MRTHVFIVNDVTFPSHLRYLFAGTGAGKKDVNISLLADIKRVRAGDFVIFYVEATSNVKGGFYGIFKIAEQDPLVFHTLGEDGLKPDLGKKLIYRTLIDPCEVYSEGVPEWEALDKLPIYSIDIQWSLIYRKLKGKRGCTPLFPWEAKRLIEMIREKNNRKIIADYKFGGGFDWDVNNRRIITTTYRRKYTYPRKYNFNVVSEIYKLQESNRAYEKHLQLYFVENIDFNTNLNPIVGDNVIWFGNEVACGTGMQKIDILTICDSDENKEYRIIELKDEPVRPEIIEQIEYYVNWASQTSGRHLIDAFEDNIQPVIVAPSFKQKNWKEIVNSFEKYNSKKISLPIRYFEFYVENEKNIEFEEIFY